MALCPARTSGAQPLVTQHLTESSCSLSAAGAFCIPLKLNALSATRNSSSPQDCKSEPSARLANTPASRSKQPERARPKARSDCFVPTTTHQLAAHPPPGRRPQQQPCGEEGPYAALLVARAVAAGSRIFRQRCCPHLSVQKHQCGGQPIVTQHSTHTSCAPKGAGGTRNHLCITYLPATVKCRNRKI